MTSQYLIKQIVNNSEISKQSVVTFINLLPEEYRENVLAVLTGEPIQIAPIEAVNAEFKVKSSSDPNYKREVLNIESAKYDVLAGVMNIRINYRYVESRWYKTQEDADNKSNGTSYHRADYPIVVAQESKESYNTYKIRLEDWNSLNIILD